MIRTFIAIKLNPLLCDQLGQIKSKLDWGESSIRWTPPENIHLTLRFMGDIKEKKVKMITSLLPEILTEQSHFEIDIPYLGTFGTQAHPKIIWAGITRGEQQLRELYGIIEQGLCRIGYPKLRDPFTAHITLGRIRSTADPKLIQENIRNFEFTPTLTHQVQSTTFFQSVLTGQNPVYEPLLDVKFK